MALLLLYIIDLFNYVVVLIVLLLYQVYCFVLFCLVAIHVSVQYNGGLLTDIVLLIQCCYHRGTHLNAMERFCLSLQPLIPPKRFDIFPPDWGVLRRSRCVHIFLKKM